MEQVTYKDAAELLGKHIVVIRDAASNGVLTQVPTTKRVKHVIKEQVLLFKGKRLSLHSLSLQEREKWEEYRDAALNPLGLDTVNTVRVEVAKQSMSVVDALASVFEEMFGPVTGVEMRSRFLHRMESGVSRYSPLASGKS